MHIAVIMDGNRRFGKENNVDGHEAGFEAMVVLLRALSEKKVDMVSLFVWSTHNWQRSARELASFRTLVKSRQEPLMVLAREHSIVFRVVTTDTSHFAGPELASLRELEQRTQHHTGMTCHLCCSYSSRQEMQQAALKGSPMEHHLLIQTPVDILLRTAEQRLSDFLLWQSAFAEIYFWKGLFPAFDKAALDKVLEAYEHRERRFGR